MLKKPTLDPDVLANYKPIWNLAFISKILEKAVANQLCDYLDTNGLLGEFQSGFRFHHRTETALLKVTDGLFMASDNGLILLLLDLSAAFDTIWLEQHVGIKGTALAWFKSYLYNIF